MVRKNQDPPCSSVSHMSLVQMSRAVGAATGEQPTEPEGTLAKIHQALQPVLNEMFFTRRLILVEGMEDVAYLLAYFNLLEKSEDYRRMGCHIVPDERQERITTTISHRQAYGNSYLRYFRCGRRQAR